MATMPNTQLTNALILFCQGDGTGANTTAVTNLQSAAFARIVAGGGVISTELSGSLYGNVFTFQVISDAASLFATCTDVLSALNNDASDKCVQFDFRQLYSY